jgi:ribosome-associated protein
MRASRSEVRHDGGIDLNVHVIDPKAMAIAAARAAAEKQGRDILVLDVGALISILDHFVLISASTDRQVKAIVDAVETSLREHGVKPLRREGEQALRWVLLDYGDIVVHIFHEEERAYYELERLWKDAPVIDAGLDDEAAAAPAEHVAQR